MALQPMMTKMLYTELPTMVAWRGAGVSVCLRRAQAALGGGVHGAADRGAEVHDAEEHADDAEEEAELGDDVVGRNSKHLRRRGDADLREREAAEVRQVAAQALLRPGGRHAAGAGEGAGGGIPQALRCVVRVPKRAVGAVVDPQRRC
jgi:hypothetical protein